MQNYYSLAREYTQHRDTSHTKNAIKLPLIVAFIPNCPSCPLLQLFQNRFMANTMSQEEETTITKAVDWVLNNKLRTIGTTWAAGVGGSLVSYSFSYSYY